MIRFAVLAAVVVLAPFVVRYPELETQILTFGLLAISFSLLLGEMGFLSFGQATFNGVGAYAAARMLIDAHAALPLALLVALAAGALAASAVGALAIGGRGVYGVMLTFAFNEMAYYIAFQWRDVTGGDNGLRGIPRPGAARALARRPDAVLLVRRGRRAARLRRGAADQRLAVRRGAARDPRERGSRARDRLPVARASRSRRSRSPARSSGLAGGLYAELYRFVPLTAIDLDTSTNVVIAALLGGTGSPFGALLGAAIFTVLSDSLSHVWSHWPLIFGVVFCAVVLFFRGGLWSLVDRRSGRAAHA